MPPGESQGSSLRGQLSFCSQGWERQNSTAEQQPHLRGAGEWNQDWDMAHEEPEINREQPKPKSEPNKGTGLSLCGTSLEEANPIKVQIPKVFFLKEPIPISLKPKLPKPFPLGSAQHQHSGVCPERISFLIPGFSGIRHSRVFLPLSPHGLLLQLSGRIPN